MAYLLRQKPVSLDRTSQIQESNCIALAAHWHCSMKPKKVESREQRKRTAGFSLTELVVALAVAMVLMAASMPAFLRAYHSYQLTNAASQMADILRLTRYEAIRRNTNVSCVIKPYSADPTLTNAFADVNGDGLPSPLEKIILLGGNGTL